MQVPATVVALTAGVDVQDNRLKVEVLGYGWDGKGHCRQSIALFMATPVVEQLGKILMI